MLDTEEQYALDEREHIDEMIEDHEYQQEYQAGEE